MDADQDLVDLASVAERRCERALGALYGRHRRSILRLAWRMLRDTGLAEDVVTETFYAVWRNAAKFRGESSASAWIHGIAKNRALGRLRHERRRRAVALGNLDEAAHPTDALRALEVRAELARVAQAVDALPKEQRRALLATLAGSHEEAAVECGATVYAVKVRTHRARVRLRKWYG